MTEQVWLVLNTGAECHVLPVTEEDGVDTLAPGHVVSSGCQCRPVFEEHPLGGARLVSHTEPSWPGAERQGVVQ